MRGRATRTLWRLPALVALAATPAAAQRATRTPIDTVPRVGERVRLRSRWLDAQGLRIDCDGRLRAVEGDTLVVESRGVWHACPRQVYPSDAVESVQVLRGNRGSRLAHAALGLAAGAGVGALVGYTAARVGDGGGEDESLVTAVLTIGGGLAGGTLGVVVGALLPAGGQWVALPSSAPVRVAVLMRRF